MGRIARHLVAAAAFLGLSGCSYMPDCTVANETGREIIVESQSKLFGYPWMGREAHRIAHGAISTTVDIRDLQTVWSGGCRYSYPAMTIGLDIPETARSRDQQRPDYMFRLDSEFALHLVPQPNSVIPDAEVVAAGFPMKPEIECRKA